MRALSEGAVRIGSAAARLLTLSIALEQALKMGDAGLVRELASAKEQAVDQWIAERLAADPRCFDLPSPLQRALLEAAAGE